MTTAIAAQSTRENSMDDLLKATKPFAEVARGFRASEPDSIVIECTLGECRRVLAVYRKVTGEK